MSQRIYFGTNLGFAKYVWGPQAALDLVVDHLGLTAAEPVADNDFGPAFHLRSRQAFHQYHQAVGEYARGRGMLLPTVFTFYRDSGAVAHPNPAIHAAAVDVLSSVIAQAAAVGARFACAALMTANREDYAADPQGCRVRALQGWRRCMEVARAAGLEGLLVEMSAQAREECATIAGTADTLRELNQLHAEHPESTVPIGLCYDLGHGISAAEAPDPRERDFRCWFEAFPTAIREIHVKNTDPLFIETWPFTPERQERGIIDPDAVVAGIRDRLRQDIYLMLEISGKRGREIGEQAILADLKATTAVWTRALQAAGYRQGIDGAWELSNSAAH